MLRITPVAIEVVQMLQPMIEKIQKRDRNMAEQLSDASSSTAANICEGNGHEGRARRAKYLIALGEVRETVGWIPMAEAAGFATRPEGIDAKLNHIIGVLVKLTR